MANYTVNANEIVKLKERRRLRPTYYEHFVFRDTPAGYWRLGDETGTTAVDVMGSNHGTLINSPTLREPGAPYNDPDYSMKFSSSAQTRINVGTGVMSGSELTYEFWMKVDSYPGSTQVMLWDGNSNANKNIWFQLNTDGTITMRADSDVQDLVSPSPIPKNKWNYIVGTYSTVLGPNNRRLYINGKIVANNGFVTPETRTGNTYLTIGAKYDGASDLGAWFDGWLDEVAVYNSVINPAQVHIRYNVGGLHHLSNALFNPKCESAWAFDELGGSSNIIGYAPKILIGNYVNTPTLEQADLLGLNDYGWSARFDAGSNEYAELNSSHRSFTGGQSFSIETWVKFITLSGTQMIVARGKDAEGGIFIFKDSDNVVKFRRGDTSTSDTLSLFTANTSDVFHIACSYDGTTMKGYVNGRLIGMLASSIVVPANLSHNWRFAGYMTNANYASAWLDNTILYHTPLTAQEVLDSYNFRASKTFPEGVSVRELVSVETQNKRRNINERVKLSDLVSLTKKIITVNNNDKINLADLRSVLKNPKYIFEKVKLSDILTKYFGHGKILTDRFKLTENVVRLPIRLSNKVKLFEHIGAFIPRERPANDIVKTSENFDLKKWKLFGRKVKLKESISISRIWVRITSDTVRLSESFIRSLAASRSKTEIVKLKEKLGITYIDLTYDFWSEIVLTKQSQSTFGNRFTIYTPNLTEEFWAEVALSKQTFAEFIAKIDLFKTRARFFGQGGRGVLIGGNYSVCPTPLLNGIYVKDPINLEILSASVSGAGDLSWSVRATSSNTAQNTLERISIRLANEANKPGSGVSPFLTRESLYITNKVAIARAHVTGTYNKTSVTRFVPSATINNFSGTFLGLAPGKYQLIVEATQALSGNKYMTTQAVVVGSDPYDVTVGINSTTGNVPLTVSFTSSRIDGDAAKTNKIIWEFEPGKRVQFGDTVSGRNPSYTYKSTGLYMPIVTYVLNNGYEISKTVSPVYEEGI